MDFQFMTLTDGFQLGPVEGPPCSDHCRSFCDPDCSCVDNICSEDSRCDCFGHCLDFKYW